MLPKVRYKRSGLETSRLALGLSRLHRLSLSSDRQNLLACAADLGFRHFDAARSYGDGLAEAELGRFLRGRRHDIVVATKYGYPANRLIERIPKLLLPLGGIRSVARRLGWRNEREPFTARGLRASLERSLRALRIDTIDILFLHDPDLSLITDAGDLVAEVGAAKSQGDASRFWSRRLLFIVSAGHSRQRRCGRRDPGAGAAMAGRRCDARSDVRNDAHRRAIELRKAVG